jgi:uncharacterized protein
MAPDPAAKEDPRMTDPAGAVPHRPVWVDLASDDPLASHAFYGALFGWDVVVSDDPQYGGYGIAQLDGRPVAGIGGKQAPDAPTAWSVYIGTPDADATARAVAEAGGTVVVPPFPVGDQGRIAVFQDPSGAFASVWQPLAMRGFEASGPNAYGWAELNARGFDRAAAFYATVFGWTTSGTPLPDGNVYHEFRLDGESVAGGLEMNPAVPPEVPGYWMPYFEVADLDASFRTAIEAEGRAMVPPLPYPGGRFAILSDPQGAAFGLIELAPGSP